jgi:isoleucyl-tRNA synthetase
LTGYSTDLKVEQLAIDEWAIEQADLLIADCIESYDNLDFGAVLTAVHNFCREQLSKFYLDAIKDRMYCEATDAPERISGQRACCQILVKLLKILAPILAHTAEEAWMKLGQTVPRATRSIHESLFDGPSKDRLHEIEDSPLQERFAALLVMRDAVNLSFETYKSGGEVKDSQDAIAVIVDRTEVIASLEEFSQEELAVILKFSWVELDIGEPLVSFRKSSYLKCQRSRLRRPDVQVVKLEGEEIPLTARDRRVMGL